MEGAEGYYIEALHLVQKANLVDYPLSHKLMSDYMASTKKKTFLPLFALFLHMMKLCVR